MKRKKRGLHTKDPLQKKGLGVMDIILIVVGISLLAFTITMIKTFQDYGAIPDTLVTCVFAALAGECGIMGWIKTTKERNREHQWEQEEKREAQQQQQQDDLPRNGL